MYILCISDIHGKTGKVAELFNCDELFRDLDLIIFCGDLTQSGGYNQARTIMMPAFSSGYPLYAIPGNMDKPGVADFLDEKGINLHGRGVIVQNIGLMGLGGSNPSPFSTPNEFSEEQIAVSLEKGFRDIADCRLKLLVSHPPPYNTNLDLISSGTHVGSRAVRSFILEKGINFCISGHIHESPGSCRLGETYCINMGALQDGRFNLIKIGDNGLKIVKKGK